MELIYYTGIIVRKRPIVWLLLVLATVSMMTSLIAYTMLGVRGPESIVEEYFKSHDVYEVSNKCVSECLKVCPVTVEHGVETFRTYLYINATSWEKGSPASKMGNVSVGYLLNLRYGIEKGSYIEIDSGRERLVVMVNGVHKTFSPLDVGLYSEDNIICEGGYFLIRETGGELSFFQALYSQVIGLLTLWLMAAIGASILASFIVSYTVWLELSPERGAIVSMGGGLGKLRLVFGLVIFGTLLVGSSWGLILYDVLNDVVGSFFGVFTPRLDVSIVFLVKWVCLPSLAGSFAGVIASLGDE